MNRYGYDTFGNEVKYYVDRDTLVAYIENATIKFPLPEASSTILGELADQTSINPVQLDLILSKLVAIGFQPAAAKIMATVLIGVAQEQGVNPLNYFNDEEQALKLANDTYQVINMMRPVGNQVGVTTPIKNSKSRYAKLIRP